MGKSEANKKKWFNNPTSIGLIVAIIGIVVTIIIWRYPTKESDFNISVNPILGSVPNLGEIQTVIEIKSINGYNYPVSLTSNNLPDDVFVKLNPKYGNAAPGYESTMSIRIGSDAKEGQYIIEVVGNGGDGKEHICKYNLSVVTSPPPPPNISYTVYNDFGIASGDIQQWSGAEWGNEPPKLIEGNYVVNDAPEGNKCFAITSGAGYNNYAGWGVFLGIFENHEIVTTQTIDLDEYDNLQFWIKSTVNLKIELQEKNNIGRKSSPCFIRDFGWKTELSSEWQKIVIPKHSFRNIDFKQIWCPFMITVVGGNITFFVDDVSWIP